MKPRLCCVLIGLIVALGCGGGGDGQKVNVNVTVPTTAEKGKSINATVTAEAAAGKGFKDRVKVEVHAPEGFKVDPASFEIDLSSKERAMQDVTIEVGPDVKEGEHTLKVTSTPKGEAAQVQEPKITVK